MRHKGSLRRRIVQACVLLALVLCSVYAVLVLLSVRAIEDRLVNDRLTEAAPHLVDNYRKSIKSTIPGDPEVYSLAQMPPDIRQLPLGIHELTIAGKALHVLVGDYDGQRFAVVDDESDFERMEVRVWAALVGALVLCVALALLLGSATASRVIKPVVRLADAVKAGRIAQDMPELAAADEVGVLARTLATYQQQMERFLKREQLFTGDVSHELRTPLTIMLGAAELLEARLADRPELQIAAQRIRRTALETADRVAALLMLSRAPETLDAPLVDLAPLLEHEIERCRPLLEGKPVELSLNIQSPACVSGRPELIAIAVGNLVRNACQFTEAGFVRITHDGNELVVEDSGPGVPASIRQQVFERYVRANNDVPGTGLGLAIVQRVCEHLGWSVSLGEAPAGGSRFVITFERSP